MKITLLAALILCPLFARADYVKILSPSTPQTYSYSDVTWHTLHWNPDARQLSANITFSTYKYVSHDFPLYEDDFNFVFPGVKFDRTSGLFYARTRHGRRVDVARMGNGLVGIQLLPGSVVHIFKVSGKVAVVLTASPVPTEYDTGLHWVEDNDGFFLANAIRRGIASPR